MMCLHHQTSFFRAVKKVSWQMKLFHTEFAHYLWDFFLSNLLLDFLSFCEYLNYFFSSDSFEILWGTESNGWVAFNWEITSYITLKMREEKRVEGEEFSIYFKLYFVTISKGSQQLEMCNERRCNLSGSVPVMPVTCPITKQPHERVPFTWQVSLARSDF